MGNMWEGSFRGAVSHGGEKGFPGARATQDHPLPALRDAAPPAGPQCPETFYAGKLLCAFPSVGYACALFAHFRDGSAPFHIHCATERERDLLVQALNGARDGDYSALDGRENGMILCDPVRLPGRLTSTSREAVLVSSRLLLYRNSVATLPLLVLSLEEAELDKPKPDTLSVRQGGMRVAVRFSDTVRTHAPRSAPRPPRRRLTKPTSVPACGCRRPRTSGLPPSPRW